MSLDMAVTLKPLLFNHQPNFSTALTVVAPVQSRRKEEGDKSAQICYDIGLQTASNQTTTTTNSDKSLQSQGYIQFNCKLLFNWGEMGPLTRRISQPDRKKPLSAGADG